MLKWGNIKHANTWLAVDEDGPPFSAGNADEVDAPACNELQIIHCCILKWPTYPTFSTFVH